MNTYADKTQESRSQSVANEISQNQSDNKPNIEFLGNRGETATQYKLQEVANNSPQAKQVAQLRSIANSHSARKLSAIQKKVKNKALPDKLKLDVDGLSSESLADVNVHYKRARSAPLHAHTYEHEAYIHKSSEQKIQRRSFSDNLRAVQLVRIKLRDEDKNLMAELRQVPVNEEGDQAVEAPTKLSDFDGLAEIGTAENIVLEGHGNTNDEGITHGQGGGHLNQLLCLQIKFLSQKTGQVR